MRKRLITATPPDAKHLDDDWINLESRALVEVTSEEKEYPVESALIQERRRAGVHLNRAHKQSA